MLHIYKRVKTQVSFSIIMWLYLEIFEISNSRLFTLKFRKYKILFLCYLHNWWSTLYIYINEKWFHTACVHKNIVSQWSNFNFQWFNWRINTMRNKICIVLYQRYKDFFEKRLSDFDFSFLSFFSLSPDILHRGYKLE